ncbi:hypothetical protein IV203_036799 [Nitzschia inconspicua]|uniref:Uncharacterized protein n=1 Tax=Nitzschia inconspicua TaxID=303405 RepID=A0A9K3LHD9_9STRA|nr:hypothetical protein IV203_036799 [Nitzschia inconspicua]
MDAFVALLTGTSALNVELRTFGMAFQGAMTVRNGRNKDKSMDWFYAFCCTLLTAFAGGIFGFLWMGKPTSLITGGDVTLTLTAIAFVLATYTPFDIGFKLGNNIVVTIVTTFFAQLFRALGMIAFINTANSEVPPSKYYPTPILGPVLYGVLLGNMGAFFSKGFDGHLQQGVPFPIQNGVIIGVLYQLYANDKVGSMGTSLRSVVQSTGIQGDMDDKTFATFCASLFVVVTGILMLPLFLGPAWNPFVAATTPVRYAKSIIAPTAKQVGGKPSSEVGDTDTETDDEPTTPVRRKRSKKNSKKKTN